MYPDPAVTSLECVMSISFQIDARLGVVFTVCYERVTDSDISNHLHMIRQARAYRLRFNHLVDCCGVTSFEVSADLVRSIAGRKLFSARSHCAIVAPEAHIYGMARMFELQHSGSVQVFRDLVSATKWLNIETAAQMPHIGLATREKCG